MFKKKSDPKRLKKERRISLVNVLHSYNREELVLLLLRADKYCGYKS